MCPKLNEINAFFSRSTRRFKNQAKKKTRKGKIVYLDLLLPIIVI